MLHLVIKAVVSAIIIVVVTETARRNPGTGALIASLSLISVLSTIWLWRDTQDMERIHIGGGASRLIDTLIEGGYAPVAVLDLSANALEVAKVHLEMWNGS